MNVTGTSSFNGDVTGAVNFTGTTTHAAGVRVSGVIGGIGDGLGLVNNRLALYNDNIEGFNIHNNTRDWIIEQKGQTSTGSSGSKFGTIIAPTLQGNATVSSFVHRLEQ